MNLPVRARLLILPLAAAAAAVPALLSGCNDAPTTAVVENGYPIPAAGGLVDGGGGGAGAGAGAGTMTVFKAWWVTTLFPNPVAPGRQSETERTIPSVDFAYVLLAPDWSPGDGARPSRLIPLKSAAKLSVGRNDLLRILVSDDGFVGNCAVGKPLGGDDARLIVERIFPGDFDGVTYDPASCTSRSAGTDAGAMEAGATDARATDGGPSTDGAGAGGDGNQAGGAVDASSD